jgi:hypothetical protein
MDAGSANDQSSVVVTGELEVFWLKTSVKAIFEGPMSPPIVVVLPDTVEPLSVPV